MQSFSRSLCRKSAALAQKHLPLSKFVVFQETNNVALFYARANRAISDHAHATSFTRNEKTNQERTFASSSASPRSFNFKRECEDEKKNRAKLLEQKRYFSSNVVDEEEVRNFCASSFFVNYFRYFFSTFYARV